MFFCDKIILGDNMGAGQVRLNGVIYDNIGSIISNNDNYIFVVNTEDKDDIKYISVKQMGDKLQYILPNVNSNDIGTIKNILMLDGLVDIIKKDIDDKSISSKEDLQKKLSKIQDLMHTDYAKEIYNENDVDKFKTEYVGLLNYFDSQTKNDKLDLDNITSFEVNKDGINHEYIKRYQDGKTDILENQSGNLVNQFKEAQNEYSSLNSADGLANANNTFDMLQEHVKTNVNLEKPEDIDHVDTKNELYGLTGMGNSLNNQVDTKYSNVVASTSDNIYVDNNNGSVMTTDVNDNDVTIKKVNEDNTSTIIDRQEINEISEMSSDEIAKLLELYKTKQYVDHDKVAQIEKIYVSKLEQEKSKTMQLNQPQKRLKLELTQEQLNKYSGGYINLIVLSLLVNVSMFIFVLASILYLR